MSRQPVVVIVGRPNVGKSTLFNRLVRRRRALVHDLPGVTRDRVVAEASTSEGRTVTVVDTGGLLLDSEEELLTQIRIQAEAALRGCDAVLLLVDGQLGIVPEDLEIARFLRALGRPVVVAVNKSDRQGAELQAGEFHALGLGSPVVISAEHGHGIQELWQALDLHLGAAEPAAEELAERSIQVAIIGRTNVGKSSLLNRLTGESRVLVSAVPGTTRDAVDVEVVHDGQRYLFVDTAGIRRKGKTKKGAEVLSVVIARRHLERADLCLLVVDVTQGIARQDAHIGGYAWKAGRAVALVANKWDLVSDHEGSRRTLEDQMATGLKFMRSAPLLCVSALTGAGVGKLFPMMKRLDEAFHQRLPTGDLNRVLSEAWSRKPPAVQGGKEPKLFYAVQANTAPPAFLLFTNLAEKPHFSYLRYLENSLRHAYELDGVPIRVMIKARKR